MFKDKVTNVIHNIGSSSVYNSGRGKLVISYNNPAIKLKSRDRIPKINAAIIVIIQPLAERFERRMRLQKLLQAQRFPSHLYPTIAATNKPPVRRDTEKEYKP